MADKSGHLEVGLNDDNEIVIVHPDIESDKDGVGHIVFSIEQAESLSGILQKKILEAKGLPDPMVPTEPGAARIVTCQHGVYSEGMCRKCPAPDLRPGLRHALKRVESARQRMPGTAPALTTCKRIKNALETDLAFANGDATYRPFQQIEYTINGMVHVGTADEFLTYEMLCKIAHLPEGVTMVYRAPDGESRSVYRGMGIELQAGAVISAVMTNNG